MHAEREIRLTGRPHNIVFVLFQRCQTGGDNNQSGVVLKVFK